MNCPRCGTSRRPISPHASLDGWGRECLRFACHECGYGWTEPTRDDDFENEIAALAAQAATAPRLSLVKTG